MFSKSKMDIARWKIFNRHSPRTKVRSTGQPPKGSATRLSLQDAFRGRVLQYQKSGAAHDATGHHALLDETFGAYAAFIRSTAASSGASVPRRAAGASPSLALPWGHKNHAAPTSTIATSAPFHTQGHHSGLDSRVETALFLFCNSLISFCAVKVF